MLLTSGRILELSLGANLFEGTLAARQAEILTMRHGKRQLAAAMLHLVNKHTEVAESVMDKIAKTKGQSYIGAGADFSVYADLETGKVTKSHRQSAALPRNEKQNLLEKYQNGYNILAKFMGGIVLPSDMYIGEHFLGGGHQTLQISQSYVDCPKDASPFICNSEEIDVERLHNIVSEIPGSDAAYGELVEKSRRLFNEKQQLPDTNGERNFTTLPNGSIKLVDTIPIGPEHHGVQAMIQRQLRALENGLLQVT